MRSPPPRAETLAKPLSPRFVEALQFACELHRTQSRKATQIPYIAHLLAVASLALEHGATEDEAIAALLHDAVEDQGGPPTLQKIRARIGDVVADIVHACSDTDETPKPPWRARKERYIAHIRDASSSVRLVSAADKLHNARAIVTDLRTQGDAVWERFRGGKEGTLWYYRSMVNALQAVERTSLVAELEEVVTEMERLARTLE